MASAVATDRLSCRRKIEMWDHDPDTASPLVTSPDGTLLRYVAMAGYASFQVAAMVTARSANGIVLLEIVAATDAAGTNATQIKTSGAIVTDVVGKWAMQECTAEEINQIGRAAGHKFTHVGARLTMATDTDEACVMYIRDEPLFQHDDLTPATTLA